MVKLLSEMIQNQNWVKGDKNVQYVFSKIHGKCVYRIYLFMISATNQFMLKIKWIISVFLHTNFSNICKKYSNHGLGYFFSTCLSRAVSCVSWLLFADKQFRNWSFHFILLSLNSFIQFSIYMSHSSHTQKILYIYCWQPTDHIWQASKLALLGNVLWFMVTSCFLVNNLIWVPQVFDILINVWNTDIKKDADLIFCIMKFYWLSCM